MAAPAAWTFILAKASNGENIGEVKNASERSVKLVFGAPSTASFKVRADNELLSNLFNEDTILKVYQGTTLRFNGPVLTCDLEGEEGTFPTIVVNAMDPAWYLTLRQVGTTPVSSVNLEEYQEGKRLGYFGTARSGDKGEIAKKIIEEAAAGTNRAVHFKIGSTFTSGSTGSYTAGPFKSALACINDLANGVDGFDWMVKPLDEGTTWGEWFAVAVLGENRASTILEYGPSSLNNMRQISYIRDRSTEAQKGIHLPESLVDESTNFFLEKLPEVITSEDATAAGVHGLNEQLAEATGLVDKTLRESWVKDFVGIRKNPRQIVAFTLDLDDGTGRVPVYGTDFNLGDFVTTRGIFGGITLFNGVVRVYAVVISLEASGTAKVKPVLVDDNNEL